MSQTIVTDPPTIVANASLISGAPFPEILSHTSFPIATPTHIRKANSKPRGINIPVNMPPEKKCSCLSAGISDNTEIPPHYVGITYTEHD